MISNKLTHHSTYNVACHIVIIQELIGEKSSSGNVVLNDTVQAGNELLLTHLLSDVERDSIRHEMKSVRDSFDSVWTNLDEISRQTTLNLIQWTSCSENMAQVETWLNAAHQQLTDNYGYGTSLDEKRTQLYTCRVRFHLVRFPCLIFVGDISFELYSLHFSFSSSRRSVIKYSHISCLSFKQHKKMFLLKNGLISVQRNLIEPTF